MIQMHLRLINTIQKIFHLKKVGLIRRLDRFN